MLSGPNSLAQHNTNLNPNIGSDRDPGSIRNADICSDASPDRCITTVSGTYKCPLPSSHRQHAFFQPDTVTDDSAVE